MFVKRKLNGYGSWLYEFQPRFPPPSNRGIKWIELPLWMLNSLVVLLSSRHFPEKKKLRCQILDSLWVERLDRVVTGNRGQCSYWGKGLSVKWRSNPCFLTYVIDILAPLLRYRVISGYHSESGNTPLMVLIYLQPWWVR